MKPRQPGSLVSVADSVPVTRIVDLGMVDYAVAYELQQKLAKARWKKKLEYDLFIVIEHPATFTLGRRGGQENLMVSQQFLKEKNVPLVHIERGGDITFHGPGQLVIYPIVNIREASFAVADYVFLLEEVMLRLAALSGVKATRDSRNHGVWVENRKLGSVGIAIRHGISFHGLALNVDLALEPFSWVNPCGLSGVRMTTIDEETKHPVSLVMIKEHLISVLSEVFAREFVTLEKDQIDVAVS